MRYKIVPVKNVSRLKDAGDALLSRTMGLPGMGLIWSPTGYGKTTSATWFVNQVNGIFIRALRLWSPKSMLTAMLRELDLECNGNNGDMLELIIQALAASGRPLFIDEADYLMESKRLVDTVRDIHDLSTVPVILIGEEGIQKKMARREHSRFAGRVSQWVAFQGADLGDARLLADQLCEVQVHQDLLERLYLQAQPKGKKDETLGGAEIRRLVVGLEQIEQYARRRGMNEIELADWQPDEERFFIGSAATPTARNAPGRGGKVASLGG